MESRESSSTARPPWNKGRLVGQKAPFKLKDFGQFAFGYNSPVGGASWRCSIWPSTANFGTVTS
jgi:hypothetical protein